MTSRTQFAINTIIDAYCMEINVGENPNTPPSMPKIKNNTPWTTPPFLENVSYRFNWLKNSFENNKIQLESRSFTSIT